MTTDLTELESFHQFAASALASAEVEVTLEDLVARWREQQHEEETIASIQRGIADAEAGRTRPLSQVDSEIRQELGFSKRN